ncbi:MAG TPA: selenium-dependent xanthine dehydrogenase [Eubacteriales bacterium]|nr:selenium-dependent xanthine dehydrogenase [Eubacteriales bacterium]
MAEFYVNGNLITCEDGLKLIEVLRDGLRLTSVKNGCGEGACGACMVIMDGKAVKACIQRTERINGRHIVTLEGLTPREREVYAYAFTEAGAVQCGFCTPGMVISAKALIDANPDPSPEQARLAIKGNICRCTGYKKIVDAILLAAKLLKSGQEVASSELKGMMGDRLHRVDAPAKAIGEALYADDVYLDGMIYGSALRSAYPRARIISIDSSEAEKLPGVVTILTAKDVPGQQKIGHLKQDYNVMIPVGEITHFLGDAVALVAAETKAALAAAKALIKVEYEVLEPVTSIAAAMDGNIVVHEGMVDNILASEHLLRGDASAKLESSAHVVTRHYSLPFTDHAFLEPECAVAFMSDDTVRVFSGDQGIYQTQKECAAMLGLPLDKVRVSAMMVGGGFGGKEDMSVQHHAALLAWYTKRPVKVCFSRAESLLVHPKRHAMEIDMTTGCDKDGRLTAMRAVIHSDTGAYASLGGPVLQRACTHAAGPYNYQDIDITGLAYYTNNPPAGAFRGFGVTQSCFALECNLNELAAMVGISAYEMRLRNAIRPEQVLPNGQIADDTTALYETLEAVRPIMESDPKAGVACAMKNSGVGVGIPDTGRCRIEVTGGKLHLYSSAACIGQGMGTVQLQMLCSTIGVTPDTVVYHAPDTLTCPNAGNTTASRQTLFTGEAVVRAAKMVRAAWDKAGSLEALEGQSFLGEYMGVTDPMGSKKDNPISHIAYGYATHVAQLDANGRLKKVTAVHDVGTAVNPTALEGQIEGGVVMSIGYALTEDFPLKDGKPLAKFGTLGLLRSDNVPELEAKFLGRASESGLARGAKGVGEICSIPTAPAIQNAYYNRDGEFRTKLPLEDTPYSKKKS